MKRQEFYRGTFFVEMLMVLMIVWGLTNISQLWDWIEGGHHLSKGFLSPQIIIAQHCQKPQSNASSYIAEKSTLPLLLFREHEKCTVSYFFFWLYRRIIGKCGANHRLMIIIIMIFFIIIKLGRTCTMRWRCSAWTPWSRRSLTWPTIYPGIYGNIYDFNIDLQIINQSITIYAVTSTTDVTNMTTTNNI